ncbi:hypothetical protein HAPAU_30660 [Halalkalicoccus paucihalophilus]|uniref:Uncharacterized protein n=1 Tax=Halalkalicoccus paucihalophilus TaxID=1008153 RepID=A0A151AAW3_9EURY|nr:hypothetical protein HAPAU_30660 [Halalkalicoccus paucihalophilus]
MLSRSTWLKVKSYSTKPEDLPSEQITVGHRLADDVVIVTDGSVATETGGHIR